VLDIEDLADLAHSVGVPVVVDNTVATRSSPGRSTS
jgi:O-acetylhomoserine/O-acetylserine sulfhydrylase-like pyridoxal-dependent enzyme